MHRDVVIDNSASVLETTRTHCTNTQRQFVSNKYNYIKKDETES